MATIWGQTDVQGGGHRSRYAATTELKLPVLSQVTLDLSGRYDSYKVLNQTVSHGTYNLGIEYRPFESLLLRGRYGTAFKVPTLADEFQGLSGYYSYVTDYLNCGALGHGPGDISDCPAPYDSTQFFGQQAGNPELKPITAKVWSYGVVWAPMANLSVNVDYLHWNISNEVNQESADGLSLDEYLCDIGTIDPNSPTCVNAFSKITRGRLDRPAVLGVINQIYTPKVNVSNEQVNAISASFSYLQDMGSWGKLAFALSYSDILKHTYQAYPTTRPSISCGTPTTALTSRARSMARSPGRQMISGAAPYTSTATGAAKLPCSATDDYTAALTGKLPAWTLYNASVSYNPVKNVALSFLVNNVFNKMPPLDRSYPGTASSPYNSYNYNVYGRAMYIEANYKFAAN